jgi:hypothetical protein
MCERQSRRRVARAITSDAAARKCGSRFIKEQVDAQHVRAREAEGTCAARAAAHRQQISSCVPMIESSIGGGFSGCASPTRSISPCVSSRTRSSCASLSSSSGESSLITLLRVVACTVGVPSSLKVFRFMIGTAATSGRSPSISCARSSQRMSMSSCFRSAMVPTVSMAWSQSCAKGHVRRVRERSDSRVLILSAELSAVLRARTEQSEARITQS